MAAQETTPLIPHRGSLSDEGPRRRSGPHRTSTEEEDDDELTFESNQIFPPSGGDFDKEDRRSWLIRCCGVLLCPLVLIQQQLQNRRPQANSQFYIDHFNDLPWMCMFGTGDDDGIWMNRKDQPGTIMSAMVWILIIYSGVTVTLLAENNNLPGLVAIIYCTICALALMSHAKTMFTDPGSVPPSAVPRVTEPQRTIHAMCAHCKSYKPPLSHHCRICRRCVSRMDHHCPWMNNCVGAGNLKHFILFLWYIWLGSTFALIVFANNYFFCSSEECTFSVVLVQLVRAMTMICVFSLLFTSSMLMNVTYGIMTGVGTIDRLKHRGSSSVDTGTDDEPIPLEDIFGIGGVWTWWFPSDPVFPDYDRIMGYSTPQRLLREQDAKLLEQAEGTSTVHSNSYSQV